MCRVTRVNADVFPGSLNSNTDIAMIVADAVKLTQSELSDSQSVNRPKPHDAIFTVSDELSLESPIQ